MDQNTPPNPVPAATTARPPPADFYAPGSYNPSDSVGYLMRRILSAVASAVERELEPTGLTHAQWVPLFKLAMQPGATVAELARLCELVTGGGQFGRDVLGDEERLGRAVWMLLRHSRSSWLLLAFRCSRLLFNDYLPRPRGCSRHACSTSSGVMASRSTRNALSEYRGCF